MFGFDSYQEHCDFNYSTDAELDAEDARIKGEANPDQAWISSGRDVWYANPYYNGPEVPHPEDFEYEERSHDE